MNRQTLADVLQDTNQTGSYTLATVLEGAEAGSQLLLRDGDALWQTPSAGLLQRQLAALQDCTATGFLTLDGQRVFAERFGAVPQLVVCGGGHVAAALVKQAKLLGLPVLAIDDREEFANRKRFNTVDEVLVVPGFENIENQISINQYSYVAIVTRGHSDDKDVLAQMLQTEAKYIGMLGSKNKRNHIYQGLLEDGFSYSDLERVHNPIGLNIYADTPEEIAVSIVAEMIQVRRHPN